MQTYADIVKAPGQRNPGGLKQFILWGSKEELDSIAALPAAPASMADLILIATDHTFTVGLGFVKIYCTMDRGELEYPVTGDRDGLSRHPMLKIFIPGIDNATLGAIEQLVNDYGIALAPGFDPQGGTEYMQVGQEDVWAHITNESKLGMAKNSEGVRGTELVITAFQLGVIKYEGVITLIP